MFQRVSGTRRCSPQETAIGNFSGGYMNKTNDCLIIGSYVCGLNSELFLHTDKNHSFFAVRDQLINTEKHLHSDFVSVRVCSQFIFTKI